MTRLQSELRRLYLARPQSGADDETTPAGLVDAQGRVRALVMELRRPASWDVLSAVWYGVQTELELPPPGIAVSGTDGLQLWFSLAEPIDATRAQGFLEALRLRFLPAVDGRRVGLMPTADSDAPHALRHAPLVPAQQAQPENWSAFIAPDLAPIFADTPWLDLPPNEEGQATLLRGLAVMKPDVFGEACERLGVGAPAVAAVAAVATAEPAAARKALPTATALRPLETEPSSTAAERFLLGVMHDSDVAMPLRIEAARALLHLSQRPPSPQATP